MAEREFDSPVWPPGGDWPAAVPPTTLTVEITTVELEALIAHHNERAQACAARNDHGAELVHAVRASYLLQRLAQIAPERVSPHQAGQA